MKKTFRVCMLIGLILSTVCFAYMLATSVYLFMTSSIFVGSADSLAEAFASIAVIVVAVVMVVMAIFSLLGLIFSAVSFTRVTMPPEKFAQKKGMPVAVIVFSLITLILDLFAIFQNDAGINALSIISMIIFLLSPILIIIDLARNKKLLQAKESVEKENPAPAQMSESQEDSSQEEKK